MRYFTSVLSGLLCGSAVAVPQLAAYSVSSGGGAMTNVSGLSLAYTIGQCDATPQTLSFEGFEVCGGYWPGFSTPVCAADFNRDGGVDFFDYLDFVDVFSQGTLAADFNVDGSIDFFDYLDFVDAFSIGC